MHFIQHGKLLKRELEILRSEKENYQHLSNVAGIVGEYGVSRIDSKVRTGQIYFPKYNQARKTHKILNSLFLEKYFDTGISFLEDPSIQYVKYQQGNYFKWHTDTIYGKYHHRSFTLSINLSDESEYDGGELLIKHNNKIIKLNKEPGSYIIFPAFLKHTATPVTKGTREAIVVWSHHTLEDLEVIKKTYYSMYPTPR